MNLSWQVCKAYLVVADVQVPQYASMRAQLYRQGASEAVVVGMIHR